MTKPQRDLRREQETKGAGDEDTGPNDETLFRRLCPRYVPFFYFLYFLFFNVFFFFKDAFLGVLTRWQPTIRTYSRNRAQTTRDASFGH